MGEAAPAGSGLCPIAEHREYPSHHTVHATHDVAQLHRQGLELRYGRPKPTEPGLLPRYGRIGDRKPHQQEAKNHANALPYPAMPTHALCTCHRARAQ